MEGVVKVPADSLFNNESLCDCGLLQGVVSHRSQVSGHRAGGVARGGMGGRVVGGGHGGKLDEGTSLHPLSLSAASAAVCPLASVQSKVFYPPPKKI